MRIEQIIKEYTPFLLKTAYLVVRDRATTEMIVEQTFIKYHIGNSEIVKPSMIKSKLLECLVSSLNEYYKSWKYQKLFIKRLFDNGEQYIHPSYHDDLSYAILRLPLKIRETATLYFYSQLTTAEISRLLGVAQGTVQQRLLKAKQLINKPIFEEEVGQQTAPINAYLTEWDERAQFVEQKYIDAVEQVEVAPPKKKRKKLMISIAVVGIAIIAVVLTEFITKKDDQSTKEQQQIGGLEQTFAQNGFEIFPGAIQKGDVLVPPDISLEIAKYYNYYLDYGMDSLALSDMYGREAIYRDYVSLYMLEKNNYQFDIERIKSYQERAALSYRAEMGKQDFQTFVQILNEQHNITEQEIIDYYFVPKELAAYFEQVFTSKYSDNKEYDFEAILEFTKEYYKIIGFDWDQQMKEYELEQAKLESKFEVLTDLSQLPFKLEDKSYTFALDDEGQIIMLDPIINVYNIESFQGMSDFYDFTYGFERELNRLSFPDFISYLQENNEKTKSLLGYIDFCYIILRSIELGLD